MAKRNLLQLRVSPAFLRKIDARARQDSRGRPDGRKTSRNEIATKLLSQALDMPIPSHPPSPLAGRTMESIEEEAVRGTLQLTNGNRGTAAKLLGVGERTLYRKIQKYKIDRRHVSGPSPKAPRHKVHVSKDSSWDPKEPLEAACASRWPQKIVTWRELHKVDCKRCVKSQAYFAAQINSQEDQYL